MASETAEEVVRWVIFGVFAFCCSASPYFSKVIFSVATSFVGDRVPQALQKSIQRQLETPTTLLIFLGFFYIAAFLAFPWPNRSIIDFTKTGLRFIYDFVLFFSVCFASTRLVTVIYTTVKAAAKFFKLSQNFIAVIQELVAIVGVIAIAAITLVTMKGIFSSGPAASDVPATLIALVSKLNFFTASVVIAASPVFRDIIAGLTVFAEGTVHAGDRIQVPGVMNSVGNVTSFELRNTHLRLDDASVITLPNRYFLTHPTINLTLGEGEYGFLSLRFTLSKSEINEKTQSEDLRVLCRNIERRLVKEFYGSDDKQVVIDVNESNVEKHEPPPVSITFNEDLVFCINLKNAQTATDKLFFKSEVLMIVKEELENFSA